QDHAAQAQRLRQETDNTRHELINIDQQLFQLNSAAGRVNLFSRTWRKLSFVITAGKWRPGAAEEENRARQFHELDRRAQEQRNLLLSRYNQAVEHRLTQEARDVAAAFYAETATRLAEFRDGLAQLKSRLESLSTLLLAELDQLTTDIKRTRFI